MGDAAKCMTCGRDIPTDAPGGSCPHCALAAAMPPSAPGADEVAAKLPAFEILGVLGTGGMGVVYKARQRALDRVVALKVLPPVAALTPGFADRFHREAKAMARLAHPNIVAVHDFGEAGGLFYLVLEYVDGVNVREAMAKGRITPAEALTIVPQICDALQYAHDRGVVHRDIKPENVLMSRDGRVKVADFGLAKLADREAGEPSLTGAGQVMGTLRYMAPEQWERPKEVDHRADIYSLGVVFYEMLTGELPVGRFAPPSKKSEVDARIDAIVFRTLERERDARYQRADDVKTSIGAASAPGRAVPSEPPPIPVPPPPTSLKPPRRAIFDDLFGPPAPGSKWSKLAIACLPASIVAWLIVEANANTWYGAAYAAVPTCFCLFGFSALAWGRIRHSQGMKRGLACPAFGFLTALAIVPFAAIRALDGARSREELVQWERERQAANEKYQAEQLAHPRVVDGVTIPVHIPGGQEQGYIHGPKIQTLVRRLQAVHPTDNFDVLKDFYSSADEATLRMMPTDQFAKKAPSGALGLPVMAIAEGLPPLSEYKIGVVTVEGDQGTVTLAHYPTHEQLLARVEKVRTQNAEGHRWVFSMAPVEKTNLPAQPFGSRKPR